MRVVLYVLFALGGLSGLIYEMMWMKSFRVVFGSSSRTTVAVLAAFLAGIALGNLLGTRLAKRGDPVRKYGWTQIVVAISALLVGLWLSLFNSIYINVYDWLGANSAVSLFGKLVLAFLAVGPPTIAMGATLPLVSQAVVSRTDHVARRTGVLYSLNLLGASAGALLAGIFLPPSIGIRNSLFLAILMNLGIGVVALRLHARAPRSKDEIIDVSADPVTALGSWPVLVAISAISGFGTLTLQVMYMRLFSQNTDDSVYSVVVMLVVFLLFLAIGAMVVARWLDQTDPWRFLAWTQAAAAVMIVLAPLLFPFIGILTGFTIQDTLTTRMLKTAVGSVAILGPSVLLIGAVLPSTWKLATRQTSTVGAIIGALTSVHALAAVGGALIANFVFFPRLGLNGSILVAACLYLLLAMTGFWRGYQAMRRWAPCAACVALMLGWYFSGIWQMNTQPRAKGDAIVRYHDDNAATVAVIQQESGHRSLVLNHRHILSSTFSVISEVRQGRMPLLLHPSPKRVTFIGAASGMRMSAVLDFPVERVLVMETVPGVVNALGSFEHWNRSVFKDPRVQVVVTNGRNHLFGTDETFDVIIGDVFVPWHDSTSHLFTVEHFEGVAARLAPGGIFTQWLLAHQLTVDELRTITASLQEAFPAVTLWRLNFSAELPRLGLVAYRDRATFEAATINEACERLGKGSALPARFLSDPMGLQMLYVCGDAALRQWADGATLNTDDQAHIEYTSPRQLYRVQHMTSASIHEFLATFRPRAWSYKGTASDRPIEDVFRAADLLHDANQAKLDNNFEKEYRYLRELIGLAGHIRAVAEHVIGVSARYRSRHMNDRSDQLLADLIAQPQPPVSALVALADSRRLDGKDTEAIALLERAVEMAPDTYMIRHALTEILKRTEQYEPAEPHLRQLLERTPNAHYVRLDLAYVLDQQGKNDEARQQVDEFRQRWDGANRKAIWGHLRNLRLGSYVDEPISNHEAAVTE